MGGDLDPLLLSEAVTKWVTTNTNGRKMALGGIMAAVSIVLMLLSAVVRR